jgi:predicted N-acetyltransferase YhbS
MIRQVEDGDREAIAGVIVAAFGVDEGKAIVALVDALSSDPTAQPVLSLVAESDHKVVGHILFSAVRLGGKSANTVAAILAPLAVHPAMQRQGIGGELIKAGLRQLRSNGVELVFVLGHPGYYPRYGFLPAGLYGLDAPYPIAPQNADAWMVQELAPNRIDRVSGTVHCADALDHPEYWIE